MRDIRCSRLPTFAACPTSLLEPTTGKVVDGDHELRRVGNATHECLALAIKGGTVDAAEIAKNHQIKKADDVHKMLYRGMKQYKTLVADVLGREPKEVITELPGEDEIGGEIHLTGTCDLLLDEQIVHDHKSGYKIYEPRWQINGYKRLFGAKLGTIGWLRDDVLDVYTDLLEQDEFDDAIMEMVSEIGKTERFGGHCFGCARQHECETYREHMRNTALTFESTKGEIIDVKDLLAAYPKAKLLEQYLARYKKMLRAAVDLSDSGTVDLGDGTELYVLDVERDVIDAKKAFQIANKYMSADEFLGTLKVTKEQLLGVVKDKAERGQKGKKAAQFMQDLEAEGAVEKKPSSQMRTRRITK